MRYTLLVTKKVLIFSMFLLVFLASCQSNDFSSENKNEQLTIYTSIYPLQFIADSLTHGIANVETIFPPGVDAHTYEPTLKEMTNIAKSDMLIFFGKNMEGFSEKIAQTLANEPIHLVEMSKHHNLFSTRHNEQDPHIWLDPSRMIKMAKIIKTNLIKNFPQYEHDFKQNYQALVKQMDLLDQQFIDTLQHKNNKQIIVSHAAYGYWEDKYNIEQVPVSGITSTDEPSQKELVQLVKEIKQQQLDYIIFNQTGEHRLSTIIQEHTKTKKRVIHDLEVLTEKDIKQDENYITLMEKNLQTLDDITS